MANETNVGGKSKTHLKPQRSVRQLMESVAETLGQTNSPDMQPDELLSELVTSLEHRLTAPDTVAAYEDALERAPWLTTERERLKQQQTSLRQALTALVEGSRETGVARESARELSRRITDLAEQYVDYDVAEQNFFQAAFAAPDWAT